MSLTDDLSQLTRLHAEGSLTDQEFADAKKKLLSADRIESAAVAISSDNDGGQKRPVVAKEEKRGCRDSLLIIAGVCGILLIYLLATAPAQVDQPKMDVPDQYGLVSSGSRINIGTRLYLDGKAVGTVLSISNKDPLTGQPRDVVEIQFDSSTEPEWKTRDVVKKFFRVRD